MFKKMISFLAKLIGQLIPYRTKNIKSTALIDMGLVRQNNEDSYLSLAEYQLWAVADGMGGCESGEIASAIALNCLKNAIVAGDGLAVAVEQCHHAVQQAATDGYGGAGMGTTIVVLQILNKHYQIAWVGDSRAYLYRSKLKCISKDHSYIQQMLDLGLMTEDEIDDHPYKNVITQALGGTSNKIKVDSMTGKLQKGDIFLLCSDGLSGEVTAANIEQTVSSRNKTLEQKTMQLVDQALMAGGLDNIAVILVGVGVK
jgi:protein phosphatase